MPERREQALGLLEARERSLLALKALEGQWRAQGGLKGTQALLTWTQLTGSAPSRALSVVLEEAFRPPAWGAEQGEATRAQLLRGREALWERLLTQLQLSLLPAARRWSPLPDTRALPEALCLALPHLGVSVERAEQGPRLCSPKVASRVLRAGLSDLSALFSGSVERGRPFSLQPDEREGARFEALTLCLLNTPSWVWLELSPRYQALFERALHCPLTASPAGLYDDLALGRDISLRREASPQLGLSASRGWLQLGLSALPDIAERKAHGARARGGAHPITPHHLARSCPPEHPLWRLHDHTPRTHEGRALAIRSMIRTAIATRPQLTSKGDLRGLLAPLVTLPPPLVWQLTCDAQTLIDRSTPKGRRRADPS